MVVHLCVCEGSGSRRERGKAEDNEELCTAHAHREAEEGLTAAPRRGRKPTSCMQLQLLL